MGGKKHKKHKSQKRSHDHGEEPERERETEVKEEPVEKPGLKLILNLKGASTPTSDSVSEVYHEEKRHKHKKKKKKKSSDKEKHRPHESRKRERELSESEVGGMTPDPAEPPLKKKMVEMSPMATDSERKDDLMREPRACTIREDEPSVLKMCLDYLHKSIQRKDVHGIFAFPVNDVIAPGYSTIIPEPMDFSTMGCKLEDADYKSVAEYKRDFVLMCNNAMTYNRPETIFYREAKRLFQSGSRVLSKEKLLFYKRSLSFMSNITVEELGLDQVGEEMSTAAEVAVERVVERDKAIAREKKKTPKDKFEAIADNLTPEEILQQAEAAAKGAADRLTLRKPDSNFGFLRRRENGSTTFNILNPDNDGIVSETERVVSLGMLMGKLNSGTGSIAGFKEDKRNRVIPVNYLNYGPFSSFAPTYDSSFANVTKEESDLLLSTYGDDTGLQYARSVLNFVENAGSFAVKMVDEILDNLTKGEHMKAQRTLDQKKNGIEIKENLDKDKKKKKSKNSKSPASKSDTGEVTPKRSLSEMGVDVSFLDNFGLTEEEQKEKKIQETQQKLDQTAELIQSLQKTQHERLSLKPPLHLAHAPGPSEKEVKLADKVCQELKELAKGVNPSSISSEKSLRHAMGVSLHPTINPARDGTPQGSAPISQDTAIAQIDRELEEFLQDEGLEKEMDMNESPLAPLPLS